MKFLAIGDFHGKFPKKFESIIKKENIDAVISVGDYIPFFYRKIWFKHCFRTGRELWEFIGKKKYKKLVTEDQRHGEEVLKKINKLPVPVFTVLGNSDYPRSDDVSDYHLEKTDGPKWKWAEKEYLMFTNTIKKYKNIKRVDYSSAKIGDYILIGMRGHSFPGKPRSKSFKRRKEHLSRLFKKFRKENREGKVIFVSHTPPNNTKLDKIGKQASKEVRGKHFGSKLTSQIIKKHRPVLNICGHVHEAFGKDKLGKTVCVNTGAAGHGEGAIIELKNGKAKVKLIR